MRFSEIQGYDELKYRLINMVKTNRLGHILLFCEADMSGVVAIAVALAQYVNCTNKQDGDSCGNCPSCFKFQRLVHPDLHFAFPVNSSDQLGSQEKKKPISDYFLDNWRNLLTSNPFFGEQDLYNAIGITNKTGIIGVNEARNIMDKLLFKPYESEYKIMIIWLPEKMNAEAANKLLKLFEEPPAGTLFLLVTHAPDKLLPTILSRCEIVRVPPVNKEELSQLILKDYPMAEEDALTIASLSGGSYGKAVKIISEQEEENEFDSLLKDIFNAGLKKDLGTMFPLWENIADMGKEQQKEFCEYGSEFIRKIYMTAQGLGQISFVRASERKYITDLSLKIKPAFYEKATTAFDSARRMIESNVNSKLIFCDLCNRLLLYL